MSLLNTPLSDQEIDQLNRFLLERLPDDAAEGADEGVLDISELDGFLTAIISGPRPITPSEWLPVVWGEFEPMWGSTEESEAIVSLVLRHMNGIVTTLTETPTDFEPIVLEVEEDDETTVTSVDEWCVGYMKGVGLSADAWRLAGEEAMEILFPIVVFTSNEGRNRLAELDADELSTLKRSIPNAVRKLHAYWLAKGPMGLLEPFVHSEPQVGRNDPCVCGSGKKFKKCCLH